MLTNCNKIYKAAIFDMDGLLIDSERLSFECWEKVAKEAGYSLTLDIFSSIVGLTGPESHRVLREAMGSEFPAEELRVKKNELFEARIDSQGAPVMPGVTDLLDLLEKHGVSVAVATSTEVKAAMRRLSAVNVIKRFPVIVTGSDVMHKKPAPDLYLKAASLLKVDPQCCIALEDSSVGVAAARAAQMEVIMVPNMKSATPVDYETATKVCKSHFEVIETFEKLFSEARSQRV